MKSSISRRIFLSNFIVVFITIILFLIIFSMGVKQFYYGGTQRVLSDKALSNANFYNMYLKYDSLESKAITILRNYKEHADAELQIIDNNGNIISSSTGFIHRGKIDLTVAENLQVGEINFWGGKLKDTGEEVLTVITPLIEGERIVGYLRFVTSMEEIILAMNDLLFKAYILAGMILGLSLIITIILTRTIVRPIKHLTDISRRIAKGDLDVIANKKHDDEIGELSDTLNFMSDEIKKSNNLKNDFISSISHEIRTPLTSIRGWAETIENGSLDAVDTKQGINIILRESKRLTKLVEELLDFSKFDAGRINMNFEKVDLNVLVKDVVKLYKVKFKEKKLIINLSLDDKITYVNADLDRLKQVFINIIDNAYKFSNENGIIIISTEQIGKKVRVLIEDNGVGIPSKELSYVTEKFYKGSNSNSGSGLGLSISKEVIRLHKGILNVESIQGVGTKIIIDLTME